MSVLPTAIVDAHHHLWALDRGHYPWLQEHYNPDAFILGDYAPLCKDFGVPAYRAAVGHMPVVATVHVEAERSREEALEETRWLHAVHAEHGMPGAVVAWADFARPDIAERLAEQAAYPLVRGIRCKPRTAAGPERSVRGEPGSMQDGHWLNGLAEMARHGLTWDLRVPYWHLEEAAEVARDFPGVGIVLEHTGLPWDRSPPGLEIWRRGMQALAACPNVHVKLSELGLRGQPWRLEDNAPVIQEAVAIFGAGRCMFASNFPVAGLRIGYPELVHAMSQALAGLTPEDRQAVWHDNAMRFYRMDTSR